MICIWIQARNMPMRRDIILRVFCALYKFMGALLLY